MWISVELNLQRFLRPQIFKLNNRSIKHVRSLCDLKDSKNFLTIPRCSGVHFIPHCPPANFNNVNKFSTTSMLSKSKDRGRGDKKATPAHVNLNEISEVMNVDRLLSQFDKAVDDFKDEMIKHVGLRTSTGAIEDLIVKHDGDDYKLQELVQISRKPKMIVINVTAFPQTIPNILDTLSKSQMNLNPQQEGTTLYIQIPKVTREHRENLAKTAKSYFIKCKDNITDVRNKHVKDVKKKSNLPLDLSYRVEGYISTLSHDYIDKAQKLLQTKQKELLGESE